MFLAPVLATLLRVAGADAQWAPDGVSLSGGNSGFGCHIAANGAGGAYVAWTRTEGSSNIYMQQVTATGIVAPGWPSTGLPLATQPFSEGLMDLEANGTGGVFVVWYAFFPDGADDVLQHIGADASPLPGWPAAGLRIVAPRRQDPAKLASNGAGGVYVLLEDDRNDPVFATSDIYGLHLLSDGTSAPGWPMNGLPISIGPAHATSGRVVPDGAGGAYFAWADTRDGSSRYYAGYGIRMNADGTVVSGWEAGGQLLAPNSFHDAASDGAGGLYVVTSYFDQNLFADQRYYLSRILGDGTIAPGWPPEGLLICEAPGNRYNPRVVPDGQGGALVTWYDYRTLGGEIYLVRVRPDGTLAPGWAPNGTRISDPMNHASGPEIVGDGAGGAYVVWKRGDVAIIQHLTGTGQSAAGWPAFGMPVASTRRHDEPAIVSDGQGGAIVAWSEVDVGRKGIWAQRFVARGIVATQLSLLSAVADAGHVRLEWFSATGAGLSARVERRADAVGWRSLGAITADGSGRLSYEDREVTPGTRYAYRLAYRDEGIDRLTTESWVEVPAALELALEGFRPNPAVGSPRVSLALPAAGPGRLELFDLAGRRVAQHDLASLPAGRHIVAMAEGEALPPAAYVLRLQHGGRVLTARGVIVR